MPQKKRKPEETVAKLWQVDVLVSRGESVVEAVRSVDVTQVAYCRRKKFSCRTQRPDPLARAQID